MNLAIKGHATRGKEVIEILEMLGGKNIYKLDGKKDLWYILSNSTIENSTYLFQEQGYKLDEFLEKYPYKVGDKVFYKTYGLYLKIKYMLWSTEKEQVIYRLDCKKLFVATADELQPCKEQATTEEIKLDIPEGYEFFGVDDDKKQVVFTKIGYHHPKTYEECCEVLGYEPDRQTVTGYDAELIENLQTLKMCRDAYWKIAGDWKPDWETDEDGCNEVKFCIKNFGNEIVRLETSESNTILAFPTAEMRDAFLENFKDLIEDCKELL